MPTSLRTTIDMEKIIDAHTARFVRAVCVSAVVLAATLTVGAAHAQSTAAVDNPPQAATQSPALPRWSDLSPAQKQALAPLESEWADLDAARRKKWLVIGNKFATMTPDEQQRVQDRMRDWVKLTPEQRRIARENYLRAKKLQPDQKSAQWEQYQQLPEEEKKKLAAETPAKKHVATLPSSAQRKNSKTVPPIKAASKPVLEQSVTPQAASQSALQAPAQTNTK